jgi:hypothetical protein
VRLRLGNPHNTPAVKWSPIALKRAKERYKEVDSILSSRDKVLINHMAPASYHGGVSKTLTKAREAVVPTAVLSLAGLVGAGLAVLPHLPILGGALGAYALASALGPAVGMPMKYTPIGGLKFVAEKVLAPRAGHKAAKSALKQERKALKKQLKVQDPQWLMAR